MMRHLLAAILLYSIGLCACKQKPKINEAADKDLLIQIVSIHNSEALPGNISYHARLTPRTSLLEGLSETDKNRLIYQMDSCFYLMQNTTKIYARLVQPVATGTTKSYDYVIDFETIADSTVNMQFVYQDKYLTRKSYTLSVKAN